MTQDIQTFKLLKWIENKKCKKHWKHSRVYDDALRLTGRMWECDKSIQIVGNYETFKWLCRACHGKVDGKSVPNRNNAGREKIVFIIIICK